MSFVRKATITTGAVAAVGAIGAAVVARQVLADRDRREQLRRQARIWRLTARRAAHFGVTKARGVGATDARRAELD